MRNLKILQAALAVIGIHAITQLIVCRKPVFTQKEHFYCLESKSKTENNKVCNRSMCPLIIKSMNNKKVKIDFHDIQTTILTNTSCLFHTIPTNGLCGTEQMDLKPSLTVNLTNLSLSFHVSTEEKLTIPEHTYAGFFSCIRHFLCSIFGFSRNDINVHCSTIKAKLLIAIVLFVFALVLFFNKTSCFSSKSLFYAISLNEKLNNEFFPFFIVLFFTNGLQTFEEATGILTISYSNEFANTYKNVTKHVIIAYETKEIPSEAFYEWPLLISAEISNTVTSIGEYAFYSCFNLETVII